MRTKRLRIDQGETPGTYYHLFNRAAGTKADRPFGDLEKEKLVDLIHWLDAIYTVEVIGYTAMGNHWHIIAYAPHQQPSRAEAERRWLLMYPEVPPPTNDEDWAAWEARLRDVSDFVKQLQQRFTCWFNRKRPGQDEMRRGTLWAGRFHSVLLQGDGSSAVWSCLKYVELNPVRAKIVADPADYRFCSWGRYCGSGKHPFAAAFETHLKSLRGCEADSWATAEVYAVMRSEIARTLATDAGASSEEIHQAAESAKRKPSILLRADRRVRFWTDGAVIGSKAFVQSVYSEHVDAKKAQTRRYGSGIDAPNGCALFSMRRPTEE